MAPSEIGRNKSIGSNMLEADQGANLITAAPERPQTRPATPPGAPTAPLSSPERAFKGGAVAELSGKQSKAEWKAALLHDPDQVSKGLTDQQAEDIMSDQMTNARGWVVRNLTTREQIPLTEKKEGVT